MTDTGEQKLFFWLVEATFIRMMIGHIIQLETLTSQVFGRCISEIDIKTVSWDDAALVLVRNSHSASTVKSKIVCRWTAAVAIQPD